MLLNKANNTEVDIFLDDFIKKTLESLGFRIFLLKEKINNLILDGRFHLKMVIKSMVFL